MSYINFTLTRTFNPGGLAEVLPRSESVSTGFSREGGRVEFVRASTSSDPTTAPIEQDVRLTKPVERAAAGVRDAIMAAQWVQDLSVDSSGGPEPDVVSWTFRNGGGGSALAGALPAPIQTVLDAATVLERTATASLAG